MAILVKIFYDLVRIQFQPPIGKTLFSKTLKLCIKLWKKTEADLKQRYILVMNNNKYPILLIRTSRSKIERFMQRQRKYIRSNLIWVVYYEQEEIYSIKEKCKYICPKNEIRQMDTRKILTEILAYYTLQVRYRYM